ncbi:Ppx/GppA phosphatase family protein [Streptomyces mirabilis]|uniref:Ppx/GppA phosphatase family protein n=1 Tax=Streptomyces mirabilis TaxID=68239 RepID=UPI0036963154
MRSPACRGPSLASGFLPARKPSNSSHGSPTPHVRELTLPQLRPVISLLARLGPDRRAALPGISRHRAKQSLAGALIAESLMEACGVESVEICPWSTREGLLLERLGVINTGRT